MTTLYHVCRKGWDGCELLPFSCQHKWSTKTAKLIRKNWPDVSDAWAYYCVEASQIHCSATIAEAEEFAAEFGGEILVIDANGLDVRVGREYPHPVIYGSVSVDRIKKHASS